MKQFAKLFETEKHGQILVVADVDDQNMPNISVSIIPPGLGVCIYDMSWNDDDAGWSKRDRVFEKMDEAEATEWANIILMGMPR